MNFHTLLVEQLDSLSTALDDGSDLAAILSVLVDDLRTTVPSFLGLRMSVPADGAEISFSTLTDDGAARIRSSLRLPLDLMGAGRRGASVVVYAADPGVFVDLAATTRDEYSLDGQVVLDGDLTATADPRMSGLDELGAVHQAMGMLLHDGYTPGEARKILKGRAERDGQTLAEAAQSEIDART